MEGDSEYDREWCEKMLEIATQETSSYLGLAVTTTHFKISCEKTYVQWHSIGVNTP